MDVRGLVRNQPAETWTALTDSLRTGSAKWAVFVGAGLSVGAGLPGWRTLTFDTMDRFAIPRGVVADSLLPQVLEECERNAPTPADFWEYVDSRVCVDVPPTSVQRLVGTLPFEVFVTLNYDRLLEPGWLAAKPRPDDGVMVYPNLRPTDLSDGRLVYLHGRCPGPGQCLEGSSTVLTETAYAEAYRSASTVKAALQALFLDYNVLFVATSFQDPDIASVMRELHHNRRAIPTAAGGETRRYVALWPSPSDSYDYAADRWAFDGLARDIAPLYYHQPAKDDYSNLESVLESLRRTVASE